jgi:hypothetical protein
MLKTYLLMVPLLLSACAMTPLTPDETMAGVASNMAGQSCNERGWISDLPVMASYLNAVQSGLRYRGDPALIAQFENEISPEVPSIRIEDCRSLEMAALQYAQQQAQNAQQQAAYSASMQSLSQSGQNMQSQARPRTTMCQHYDWGNMTSCNWF